MVNESRQAGTEIEVTDEMAEAGLGVLVRFGLVDYPMEADTLVVSEVFQEMLTLSSLQKT